MVWNPTVETINSLQLRGLPWPLCRHYIHAALVARGFETVALLQRVQDNLHCLDP